MFCAFIHSIPSMTVQFESLNGKAFSIQHGFILHMSQVAHQARASPGFRSMKRLGMFLLPLDGMPVHRIVTPSIKFAGTHLYTWVERGTMRVKCLAQEHNTMSQARAQTQSARSGVGRTNHEATAPPQQFYHADLNLQNFQSAQMIHS